MSSIKVGRQAVEITHPDKVLFPKDKLTKADLVAYYVRISKWMIPLIEDHPLMMQRYPNGIAGSSFIQQEASPYFPEWIEQATVEKKGGKVAHVLGNSPATLAYLANQGVITLHMWQSRADKPNYPDRLVFDLDPYGDDFPLACSTAKSFRILLERLDLPCFPMLTGSRGLHVVVPLDRSADFDEVRDFARRLGEWLAAQLPEHLTVEHRKEKRGSRLFLDALRNTYAHTAVAPYAVRPKEGAPVAAPVDWEELATCKMTARRYSIKTIFDRLKTKGDPWKTFKRQATSIEKARRQFEKVVRRSSLVSV